MRSVAQKDTKPEVALRRALHARGFRYRLHSTKVRGRPDLVLPKHSAVVFVRYARKLVTRDQAAA